MQFITVKFKERCFSVCGLYGPPMAVKPFLGVINPDVFD